MQCAAVEQLTSRNPRGIFVRVGLNQALPEGRRDGQSPRLTASTKWSVFARAGECDCRRSKIPAIQCEHLHRGQTCACEDHRESLCIVLSPRRTVISLALGMTFPVFCF